MFVSVPALVSFPAEDRLIPLTCCLPACFRQSGHFEGGSFLGACNPSERLSRGNKPQGLSVSQGQGLMTLAFGRV